MKQISIYMCIIFFSSCQHSWTQKDKDEFINSCTNSAAKSMTETKARSYCSCMLQKVQKRYPNPGDTKYIKQDKALYSMANDCLK